VASTEERLTDLDPLAPSQPRLASGDGPAASTGLSAWQRVQLARHPQRPYTLDYIGAIFEEHVELHGDRLFADDPALVGGPARLGGRPLMVIGIRRAATPRRTPTAGSACRSQRGTARRSG